MPLVKPAGYRNLLDNVENTEKAIKLVKDMFQQNLSAQLALLRVTARWSCFPARVSTTI